MRTSPSGKRPRFTWGQGAGSRSAAGNLESLSTVRVFSEQSAPTLRTSEILYPRRIKPISHRPIELRRAKPLFLTTYQRRSCSAHAGEVNSKPLHPLNECKEDSEILCSGSFGSWAKMGVSAWFGRARSALPARGDRDSVAAFSLRIIHRFFHQNQ